jgi:hypothetical protein
MHRATCLAGEPPGGGAAVATPDSMPTRLFAAEVVGVNAADQGFGLAQSDEKATYVILAGDFPVSVKMCRSAW